MKLKDVITGLVTMLLLLLSIASYCSSISVTSPSTRLEYISQYSNVSFAGSYVSTQQLKNITITIENYQTGEIFTSKKATNKWWLDNLPLNAGINTFIISLYTPKEGTSYTYIDVYYEEPKNSFNNEIDTNAGTPSREHSINLHFTGYEADLHKIVEMTLIFDYSNGESESVVIKCNKDGYWEFPYLVTLYKGDITDFTTNIWDTYFDKDTKSIFVKIR